MDLRHFVYQIYNKDSDNKSTVHEMQNTFINIYNMAYTFFWQIFILLKSLINVQLYNNKFSGLVAYVSNIKHMNFFVLDILKSIQFQTT